MSDNFYLGLFLCGVLALAAMWKGCEQYQMRMVCIEKAPHPEACK